MRKAKDSGESVLGEGGGSSARSKAPPAATSKPKGRRPAAARTPKKRASSPGRTRSPLRVAEAPRRSKIAPPDQPEEMLQRAMTARTPRSRAIWARRGLAHPARMDRTIQSMLLRQLYLAYYEERRFQKAAEVSEQIVRIAVLPDVAHQDAARAKQGLGDVEGAAGHLRLAARVGPANRKAFHWWTLGSLFYLAGRYDDAISALTRAARWGTTDKPLYQGHLAVARCAKGEPSGDLAPLIDRLAAVPAGQGYGRFVLGQLAFHDGRRAEARRYLEAFVKRTLGGRAAMAIALEGEVAAARRTLEALARREP